MAIYNIQVSNILYDWQLSMASFRFCETYLLHIKPYLLHIKPLVVNKSAISHPVMSCVMPHVEDGDVVSWHVSQMWHDKSCYLDVTSLVTLR